MVSVDYKDGVKDAVDEFYDTFSAPVTEASKFYTLYYLSEVKGIDRYQFDLFKLADRQSDSFYNYAIYACANELGNIDMHFRMLDLPLGEITDHSGKTSLGINPQGVDYEGIGYEDLMDDLIAEIHRACPDDITDLVMRIMVGDIATFMTPISRDGVVDLCEDAERKYNAFTDDIDFLKACEFIFGHEWCNVFDNGIGDYSNIDINHDDCGWNRAYGGDAWASVAKTALQKHELGENAYIDLMWSVEHNNGNFIDKIPDIWNKEIETVAKAMNEEMDETGMDRRKNIHYATEQNIAPEINRNILSAVLTYARDENIRPLYRIARAAKPDMFGRDITLETFPHKKYIIEDTQIRNLLR